MTGVGQAGPADVVVVGGGLAGHAAALAAADSGARVVLLEKTDDFGGSSALAGGGLLFAGTPLQEREGVADSPAQLRADLDAAGRGKSEPALLDAYVDNQKEVYDWLVRYGAEFTLSGQPVRRLHVMPQGAMVAVLHEHVCQHPGIDYRRQTPAAGLLTGAEPTRGVTGVQVAGEGSTAPIAARSVVLASGGFSRNRELVAQLAPQCAEAIPMGGAGNDGDGLRMARDVGADLAGIEFVEASFGASATAGVPPRLLYTQFDGGVIVNALGRQFAEDGTDIKALGRATAAQPGGLAFQVFDQAVMELSRTAPKPRDFAGALSDGLVVTAPTLGELAERIGVPAAELAASAAALSRPPFYSFACKAGLSSTYGGLRVDGCLRVLDGEGAAIPGLYAAGELVGGFHGAGYLVGSALGKAAVFGYLAGRQAVAPANPGRSEAAPASSGAGAASVPPTTSTFHTRNR